MASFFYFANFDRDRGCCPFWYSVEVNESNSESSSPSVPEWHVGFDRVSAVTLSDDGDVARVTNFRNFQYECGASHLARWETREFRLSEVCSLDFIVVPFANQHHLAHTMVSFGFRSGQHLSISVEARRRWQQPYSIYKGMLGAFPLTYVIADERDTIGERIECRQDAVHLYPSAASATESRQFLLSMLTRANQLSDRAETYHTLFNNCLTNLRDHANEIWPGRVRWGWQILFTGHAAHLAYTLGLLKDHESFDSLDAKANITDLARGNWHRADFSKLIRERWPQCCGRYDSSGQGQDSCID